ncbi:hypothetical protein [Metabacillus sediminilitoris]|uniref:hypothetical protein n=1 Tax=Metabacillus sediminilitoris TaxID=2567941 RepID=UPI0012D7706A|nr:hypothetical protein [Metabacillus sediminilitoris]QGQ45916.1 hypothetical protein GMB29_12155 [Metabacillus sediminilitoris]
MKKLTEAKIYEFEYDSEEEMKDHIQQLESIGFECVISFDSPILYAKFIKNF